MCKQSFVTGKIEKLTTDDFIKKVDSIINSDSPNRLENLDLSSVDFSNVTEKLILKIGPLEKTKDKKYVLKKFDGWTIRNVIFSRFEPTKKEKKHLYGLSFIGAKMERVVFAQAFLDKCNFDCPISDNQQHSIEDLNQIDFFFSELRHCRFCGCTMKKVDFRYAKIYDCSMRNIKVTYGDFYFCNFRSCSSFQGGIYEKCSFTNAVFENAVIRWDGIVGVLQDDIKEYREVVNLDPNWFRRNLCATSVVPPNDEDIRAEAIEIYKQLSGIYAGKGFNKDSNEAYAKMKKNERRLYRASIRASINNHSLCKLVKNIKQLIDGLFVSALGYGYKWERVAGWYVLLIMIGAFIFTKESIEIVKSLCNCTCDYSKTVEIAYKGVTYSIFNSVGSYITEYVCVVGPFWANIQTVLSFLLIGYLGFIFANKMRNNL